MYTFSDILRHHQCRNKPPPVRCSNHWCFYIDQCVAIVKKIQLELSENLTIAPLQCLACSKRPECLRILSGKVILTSIKGHNSLIDLRKMTANNPNVDLVSINSYIKVVQNLSICSKDIEKKLIFGVNQGP